MEYGPDHYLRDWDFLAQIAKEWAEIRKKSGLGSKATREQIKPHVDAILDDNSPWPNIRRARQEVELDPLLNLHLYECFHHRLKPPERQGYTFEQVLPAGRTRIFWIVVRNAETWHKSKKDTDEHWAWFQNRMNLTQELRRAIKDLTRLGQEPETSPEPETREESGEAPREPDPAASRLDAPLTGYLQEPTTDYHGQHIATPEETLELLEELCEGASEKDAIVFRDWWLNTNECTEQEEEMIARRHGLTREELNAILRRFTQ